MEKNYCPYCNKTKKANFSDEHFLSQIIAGEKSPTLRTCSDCNSFLGTKVDILFSHHSFLMACGAAFGGRLINKHTKVTTEQKLKDGRSLKGHFVWEFKDKDKKKVGPHFIPDKNQQDGSKWISERVLADKTLLPKGINVLEKGMMDYVMIGGEEKNKNKCIPALIKVLMGVICWDVIENKKYNLSLIQSNFFNRIRDYAFLRKEPKKAFSWVEDIRNVHPPIKVDNRSHYFSYSYDNGLFHGVGILYGRIIFYLRLNGAPYFKNGCVLFYPEGIEQQNQV